MIRRSPGWTRRFRSSLNGRLASLSVLSAVLVTVMSTGAVDTVIRSGSGFQVGASIATVTTAYDGVAKSPPATFVVDSNGGFSVDYEVCASGTSSRLTALFVAADGGGGVASRAKAALGDDRGSVRIGGYGDGGIEGATGSVGKLSDQFGYTTDRYVQRFMP